MRPVGRMRCCIAVDKKSNAANSLSSFKVHALRWITPAIPEAPVAGCELLRCACMM